jgi:hypothetical protein
MYEAADQTKADLVIELDYGVKPPRITEEPRTVPIYDTTPGQFTRQVVQVGNDRAGNPVMAVVGVDQPSTTTYVGEREFVAPVITYEKYLRLSARENKPATEGRQPREIWTVDVINESDSDNLRKYVPIMAAAAISYIGRQTTGQEEVQLTDGKNSDVAFVKKGI